MAVRRVLRAGAFAVEGLEGMRSLLRGSLARSLGTLEETDRLQAAWTVACGRAMAEHGEIVGFADGVLTLVVTDAAWLQQMQLMRGQLRSEISGIAGVAVREIHFERRGAAPQRKAAPIRGDEES